MNIIEQITKSVLDDREKYFAPATFTLLMSINFYLTFLVFILIIVIKRFQLVNKLLKEKKFTPQKIKTISTIHLHLCEVIKAINRIFSIPVSIALLIGIATLVLSLYELYAAALTSRNFRKSFGFFLQTTLGSFHFCCYAFAAVIASSIMKREGKKAKFLLSEIRVERNVRKNMIILRQQLKHCEVKFTCGLFDYDWKLLSSVSVKIT